MKDIVKIADTEIERIRYKGTPVVTFKMIDRLHKRNEGTAKKNFYNNIKHFEESRHFYNIPYEQWNKILAVNNFHYQEIGGHRGSMIFLTERGYLLLVKSFTDDLSWKIQEELVDHYFRTSQSVWADTFTYHTTGLDAQDFARYAKYADKDPQIKHHLQVMQLSKGMMNLRITQLDQQEEIDMLKQSIAEHKKIEDNLKSQLAISIEAGKKSTENLVDVSLIPASKKSRAKIHRAITRCIYSQITDVVGWTPPEAKYVYIRIKRSDFRKLLCDHLNIRMMRQQLDERDVEEALIFLKYFAMADKEKDSPKTKAMIDRMHLLWAQRERRQAKAQEAEMGQNPLISEVIWRQAVKTAQAELRGNSNGE